LSQLQNKEEQQKQQLTVARIDMAACSKIEKPVPGQ